MPLKRTRPINSTRNERCCHIKNTRTHDYPSSYHLLVLLVVPPFYSWYACILCNVFVQSKASQHHVAAFSCSI